MLINRRGLAVAAASLVLAVASVAIATGPLYLSRPVTTATVESCRGSAPDLYCVGTWTDQDGARRHGGIEHATKAQIGRQVKVRPSGDDAASTQLNPTVGGWIFREFAAAVVLAGAVALAVFLYKRRDRYRRENPDQLPELAAQNTDS